jgi:hypothetical protein
MKAARVWGHTARRPWLLFSLPALHLGPEATAFGTEATAFGTEATLVAPPPLLSRVQSC